MDQEESRRLRQEYEDIGLEVDDMAGDPIQQFNEWFAGAVAAGIYEPDAFILSTASTDAAPSARAVLLKGITENSLLFYTNMESRKSLEIRANPQVAATFAWLPLHRQVRFEGKATAVDDAAADEYFATRPRGARVAAHASRQSNPVSDRSLLEQVYAEIDARYGEEVPRPPWWGGWEIMPEMVEFWQGRVNRFHDRLRYLRHGGGWVIDRLQP